MEHQQLTRLTQKLAVTTRRHVLIGAVTGAIVGIVPPNPVSRNSIAATQDSGLWLRWSTLVGEFTYQPLVITDGVIFAWTWGSTETVWQVLHAIDTTSATEYWHFDVLPGPSEIVTVRDGMIYLNTMDPEAPEGETIIVYGLDVETGEARWSWLEQGLPMALALGADETTIYLRMGVDPSNSITALDSATQQIRWSTDMPNEAIYGMTIIDDAIYVFGRRLDNGDFYLRVLDRLTGRLGWDASLAEWRIVSDVIGGILTTGELLVFRASVPEQPNPWAIIALDASTSIERWRLELGTARPTFLGVVAGTVCIVSDGVLFTLDAENGLERWHIDFDEIGHSAAEPVAIDDERVYLVNRAGQIPVVMALDIDSGLEIWSREITVSGGLTIMSGMLYIINDEGLLLAIESTSGIEQARLQLMNGGFGGNLTIADRVIYIGGNGSLSAVDIL